MKEKIAQAIELLHAAKTLLNDAGDEVWRKDAPHAEEILLDIASSLNTIDDVIEELEELFK